MRNLVTHMLYLVASTHTHTHQASLSAGNNNGVSAHQSHGSEITLSADSLSFPFGPLPFTTLSRLLMMKERRLWCTPRHQTLHNLSFNTLARKKKLGPHQSVSQYTEVLIKPLLLIIPSCLHMPDLICNS